MATSGLVFVMAVLLLVGLAAGFSAYRAQDAEPFQSDDDNARKQYDAAIKAEVTRMMISDKHQELRKALRFALNMLDADDEFLENADKQTSSLSDQMITDSGMPYYVEHIKRLASGESKNVERRNHRKRNTFDSIGHQSDLGGLGSSGIRRQKVAFTFENLLPYLIDEMRRSNRAVHRRY